MPSFWGVTSSSGNKVLIQNHPQWLYFMVLTTTPPQGPRLTNQTLPHEYRFEFSQRRPRRCRGIHKWGILEWFMMEVPRFSLWSWLYPSLHSLHP